MKMQAAREVLDYCDPELEETAVKKLNEPLPPTFSTYKAEVMKLSELDANQRVDY